MANNEVAMQLGCGYRLGLADDVVHGAICAPIDGVGTFHDGTSTLTIGVAACRDCHEAGIA
jgi:hypothetical protein